MRRIRFPEEEAMRRIVESLVPADRQIHWRWVGGMFGLYIVVMIAAAGVFISHESSRKVAHERAATVAADRNLAPSHQASMPARQVSRRYD
jgi:hypothetical protein